MFAPTPPTLAISTYPEYSNNSIKLFPGNCNYRRDISFLLSCYGGIFLCVLFLFTNIRIMMIDQLAMKTEDMKALMQKYLKYPDTEEGFNQYRLDSLDFLWLKYQEKLTKCRREFSEDSVHKFRISGRRFLAMVDMVKNIYSSKYLEDLQTELKKQMKIFSDLRDTQVMINSINKIRKEYSVFDFFYYDLLAREQTCIKKIEKKIKRVSRKDIEALIFFIRIDLDNTYKNDSATFNDAFEVINEVFRDLQTKALNLQEDDPRTIHELRLVFKNFRYMIEAFIVANELPKDFLDSLSDYQTLMGEVQDAEVLISRFNEYVLVQDSPEDIVWVNANKVLEERLREKIRKFMEHKDRLNTFWTL